MPRFSVVVPAYNAESTLAETLDAVLAQTFDDWECVVVDDGSSDQTPGVAASYNDRDARFRVIRQENTGTAGAYRTGIRTASSDLLVICASDDMLLPAHLATMDQLIREELGFDIYSSNGEYLEHESGLRRVVYTTPEWQSRRSLSFEQLVEGCFFSVGAVFRRRVFDMTGGHRRGVYVDDYDLWLRAMARGARQLYTPDVLAVHRVSSFQQSANVVRVFRSNIEAYEHLLAEESLTHEQSAVVEASIAVNREWIRAHEVGAVLEAQASGLRRTVERIVGPRLAPLAMWTVHRVTWGTRPLRRWMAARRHVR